MDDKKHISMADFLRFLRAVKAERPCERCGSSAWAVYTRPDASGVTAMSGIMATSPEFTLIFSEFYPFVMYGCKVCGNTYLHNWITVSGWLKDNEEKADG